MDNRKILRELGKDVLITFTIMWVIQLCFGAYHIFVSAPEAALELASYGDWMIPTFLIIGAALISIVLTIAYYVIMAIMGIIILLWAQWRDSK